MAKKIDNRTSIEKILKAGLKEFAEYGFEGARVDRIAKKAGINKAMIYYHFKSKEALYEKILTDITGNIYSTITNSLDPAKDETEQIQSVINQYIQFLNEADTDIIRTMIREIASGGKYFKKIFVPKLLLPIISIMMPVFAAAQKKGKISSVNPYYTFIQILGSIIFFNLIRLTMNGTPVYDLLFSEGYLDKFRDNLLQIYENGIFIKGDKK